MDDPAAFLDAFASDGWEVEPFERMLDLVHADSENAFRLLQLAIARGGERTTFLDAAVSFVPEDRLPDLAVEAAEAFLRDQDNDVAAAIISYLTLQRVTCLQPFLQRFLSDGMPNEEAYDAERPWRGASDVEITELLASLRLATSPERRLRYFRCILESRRLPHIADALATVGSEALPVDASCSVEDVGFDDCQRPLFSEKVFHICLPDGGLPDYPESVWLQPGNHPTWRLPTTTGRHRLGGLADAGAACGVCGGSLHNLITFDPTPDGIVSMRPRRLQIVTCLSCLGWTRSPLFFKHDETGTPTALDSTHEEPEFPSGPIKEMWVELSPTPPRWQWQDWALSNSRENLHRVGGHPTWIQSAEYPTCPDCQRLMPMLLQLDSELPTQDGHEWLWGSGGICYVFWCDGCQVSASLWQCT